jgi:hypothetical protein
MQHQKIYLIFFKIILFYTLSDDGMTSTPTERLNEDNQKLDNVRLKYEIEKLKTEKEVLIIQKAKLECEIQTSCKGKH